MARPIPTHVGDVLILQTTQSYTVYAVGQASRAGQQDFSNETDVKYANDFAAAVAQAKALAGTGRRIFLLDIDVGDWSEISH
jgi:hypothetical protein